MLKNTKKPKIYDISNAEKIIEYALENDKVTLYKAEDGSWFYHCTSEYDSSIEPKHVKNIFKNRNRQDLIEKYFNQVLFDF